MDEKIADKSYVIPSNNNIKDYPKNVIYIVEEMKNNNEEFNIVVCAAGGWAMVMSIAI